MSPKLQKTLYKRWTKLRFHGPNGYYDTAYPGQKLAAIAKKCRGWASIAC